MRVQVRGGGFWVKMVSNLDELTLSYIWHTQVEMGMEAEARLWSSH